MKCSDLVIGLLSICLIYTRNVRKRLADIGLPSLLITMKSTLYQFTFSESTKNAMNIILKAGGGMSGIDRTHSFIVVWNLNTESIFAAVPTSLTFKQSLTLTQVQGGQEKHRCGNPASETVYTQPLNIYLAISPGPSISTRSSSAILLMYASN